MQTIKCALFGICMAMAAGTVYAADCGKVIQGKWEIDLGGGTMAIVDFKPNGEFTQNMPSMNMNVTGAYSISGNALKTTVDGKAKDFTVQSCDNKSISMKRNADGRIMIYKRK